MYVVLNIDLYCWMIYKDEQFIKYKRTDKSKRNYFEKSKLKGRKVSKRSTRIFLKEIFKNQLKITE